MASEKSSSDINALATEVMDLWQEHLAAYASDPGAKAELIRMLEPQRQWFADWTAMMQNGGHGAQAHAGTDPSGTASPEAGTAAAAAPSDDGALRLAQLAHRAAQLETRLAEIEQRLARLETGKSERRDSGVARNHRRRKSN